jgi:hypothetical protein
MQTFVVRVWLPDRPGALGQVASRIGAVRGDVVGIEILERGAGRAVDELTVDLPADGLVELLVAEIAQVDGVDVEDVRPLRPGRSDPGVAALELASSLVESTGPEDMLQRFCNDIALEFDCDWAAAVELAGARPVVTVGDAPAAPWIAAFIEGSSHLGGGVDVDEVEVGHPADVVWARFPNTSLAAAAGRRGRPFRWRERRQLALLAQIGGAVLSQTSPVVDG